MTMTANNVVIPAEAAIIWPAFFAPHLHIFRSEISKRNKNGGAGVWGKEEIETKLISAGSDLHRVGDKRFLILGLTQSINRNSQREEKQMIKADDQQSR